MGRLRARLNRQSARATRKQAQRSSQSRWRWEAGWGRAQRHSCAVMRASRIPPRLWRLSHGCSSA
eukprot:471927-Alexandrium_andersonii.AAC.1